MGKLTVVGVKNAKPGRHADGDGLYLLVKPTGARSWLLRIQVDGVRRDIGLGSVDSTGKRNEIEADIPILNRRVLSLVEAREKASILSRVAKAGRDPVAERDRDRTCAPTFKEAAIACHKDLQSGWVAKNAAAFLRTLEEYAYPAIGSMRVDQVEASQLRDMLAPIWTTKPEVARKVRMRAGTVLNYAKSKGWRTNEAPGKSVTVGLARRKAGKNLPSMPYADVPSFVADLKAKTTTVGRLALLFTIYTAARSGEVRQARWNQIDFAGKLWNRPASVMKMGVSHTVTLSQMALDILETVKALRVNPKDDAFIFPSTKGAALSDMTLSKIMRDAELPFVPHGFRSSFRDFAAEKMPTIPDPVAEAALAHVVPDKVERAYKRTNFLEMRRQLLDGWGAYIDGKGNVSVMRAVA